MQMAAIQKHVRAHPEIELVWYDYWSMPQGEDKVEWEDGWFSTLVVLL